MKDKIKNITLFDYNNYSNLRLRRNLIKRKKNDINKNKEKKIKNNYILPKSMILNILNEYCKFKKKSCKKIIKIPNKKRILKKFKKI